jgi:chromate transporter
MSSQPQPTISQLFFSFFRLGLTAFGGPSMVVYIRKMAVDKKHWLDSETFNHGVALCQMIPGATAMQTAAYVGLKTRGVFGALISFIGFGLPAFLLMLTFAALYTTSYNMPAVVSAFNGLQAIIVAIIANATISFAKNFIKSWKTLAIAGISAVLFFLNVNPIIAILLAAVLGWLLIKPKQSNSVDSTSSLKTISYSKPLVFILTISVIGFLLLFIFNRTLYNLAFLMFRIDLFAFGGGFASVPLMFHEIVDVRHWMDSQTLMNGIALGQITPGPIVITATFVGYLLGGWFGGVVATIGIFLASFILVVAFTPYFDRLRSSTAFNKVIGGVLSSFVGFLFTVTIRFALNVHWDLSHILLAGGSLIALLLKVDILWVVLVGTVISIIIFL